MLLGITGNLQEKGRLLVRKQVGIVTTFFVISMIVPFLLYGLFHFKVIPSKSGFSEVLQEPIAKVITAHGTGTAFLINETILLTARHVVENTGKGGEVDLYFENSKNQLQSKAKVLYVSPSDEVGVDGAHSLIYFLTDFAILEMPSPSEIDPLYLGDSESVINLDEVILIGFPNGDYSITKGNINSDSYQGADLFKLDATANPGNSGGPCILKDDNSVIGIIVGGSATAVQGENIAMKINLVKEKLDELGIDYD